MITDEALQKAAHQCAQFSELVTDFDAEAVMELVQYADHPLAAALMPVIAEAGGMPIEEFIEFTSAAKIILFFVSEMRKLKMHGGSGL